MTRSTRELSATLADVVEERSFAADPTYYDGCAAVLEWATGQRRSGPISESAPLAPEAAAMRSELRLATAMLHGQESTRFRSAYISGAEETLEWILGLGEAPL